MKNLLIALIVVLFTTSAYSQKDTSGRFDARNITKIYIDIDEVFKINLMTAKTPYVTITTHSEGEYYNDISLEMETKGEEMTISSEFEPILQSGYDKLSAHKVFSLEITLVIPEDIEVVINSNIASVSGKGIYKNLQIELKSGFCEFTEFQGNAKINTYNGNIDIETTRSVVKANSRNGAVNVPLNSIGKNTLELTSINGDIRVVEN